MICSLNDINLSVLFSKWLGQWRTKSEVMVSSPTRIVFIQINCPDSFYRRYFTLSLYSFVVIASLLFSIHRVVDILCLIFAQAEERSYF